MADSSLIDIKSDLMKLMGKIVPPLLRESNLVMGDGREGENNLKVNGSVNGKVHLRN